MNEVVLVVVGAVAGVLATAVVKDWKKVYDTFFRSIPSRIWGKWRESQGRRVEERWERERLGRIAACDHPEGKVGGVVGKIVCSKCGRQRECTHHNLQSAVGKVVCSECGRQEECTHHNLRKAVGKLVCPECGVQKNCTHPVGSRVYWDDNVHTCACGARMNGLRGMCDICGGKAVIVLQRMLDELSEDVWWEEVVKMQPQVYYQTCFDQTTEECEKRVIKCYGSLPKVGDAAEIFRKNVKERQIYRELSMVGSTRKLHGWALCTLLGHENGHVLESPHVCSFTLHENRYYGKVSVCCCGSKQEAQ